jgi:hypothetical protein
LTNLGSICPGYPFNEYPTDGNTRPYESNNDQSTPQIRKIEKDIVPRDEGTEQAKDQ